MMLRFNYMMLTVNDCPVCSLFIKFYYFQNVTCVRQCWEGWGFG